MNPPDDANDLRGFHFKRLLGKPLTWILLAITAARPPPTRIAKAPIRIQVNGFRISRLKWKPRRSLASSGAAAACGVACSVVLTG